MEWGDPIPQIRGFRLRLNISHNTSKLHILTQVQSLLPKCNNIQEIGLVSETDWLIRKIFVIEKT